MVVTCSNMIKNYKSNIYVLYFGIYQTCTKRKKIESEGHVNTIMYRLEPQNDISKTNLKFEHQTVSRSSN